MSLDSKNLLRSSVYTAVKEVELALVVIIYQAARPGTSTQHADSFGGLGRARGRTGLGPEKKKKRQRPYRQYGFARVYEQACRASPGTGCA